MDRLFTMEAFVVTAERGSISGASRALGVSAATVSRALGALESRLSVSLLRRTTRSLKLTDAGERYLVVARRVLLELAVAESAEDSALETPRGVLTVTAPVTFGAMFVRPSIDAYLARNPEVRARLLLLDRLVNVVDEGIDVAVRIAHLPDSALVGVPLGHVKRVVCASPRYLKTRRKPVHPRDLADHQTIAFTALTPSETWTFAKGPKARRAERVTVRPRLTVNTAEAAIGSALEGHGITCALSYQVAGALERGDLVALLTAFEPAALPVHLVYSKSGGDAARVRSFVALAAPRLRSALAGRSNEKWP